MLPRILIDNQLRTENLNNKAKIREASGELDFLQARVDSLELTCAGLWELLQSKLGCSNEDLIQAIRTADARDGVIDGKISYKPVDCQSCGRKQLTRRASNCAWCGAEMAKLPF